MCTMSVKKKAVSLSLRQVGQVIRCVTCVFQEGRLSSNRFKCVQIIPLRRFHPLSWFQIGRRIKQTHLTALFHIADLINYKILLSWVRVFTFAPRRLSC